MTDKRHENLIPQAHVLTVEEQSKGGQKSVEVRNERKKAREIAEVILSMPVKKGNTKSLDSIKSISEVDNTDTLTALIVNATKKALGGSYRHLELLLTLTGDYSRRMQLEMPQIEDTSVSILFEEYERDRRDRELAESSAQCNVTGMVNKLSFTLKNKDEKHHILKDITTEELETVLDQIYTYGIRNNEYFGEPIDKGGMIDYIRELLEERHTKEGTKQTKQRKSFFDDIE